MADPPRSRDGRDDSRSWLGIGSVVALGLSAALLVGIALGGARWRYRRQILQAQGALAGLAVGFVAGRLTGRRR